MSEKLTDAEIICVWMSGRASVPQRANDLTTADWFYWDGGMWMVDLTLDALWKVEERLRMGTDKERKLYHVYGRNIIAAQKWHADAPTRIRALAAILRPIVEGGSL